MNDINPEWSDRMAAESTTLEQSALPEAFKRAARRGRPASDNPTSRQSAFGYPLK